MNNEMIDRFYKENKPFLQTQYPGFSKDKIRLDIKDSDLPVDKYLNYLKTGSPREYFMEQCHFFGHTFFIKKGVFIPRFETEELVEWAIPSIRARDTVLDMGTGTGNIICTLSLECQHPIDLIACDISTEALNVAKKNASLHAPQVPRQTKCSFIKSDRFLSFKRKVNVIISNPPYIKKEHDKNLIHPQVLQYEPHRAFLLEDTIYENWYRTFFYQAAVLLKSEGYFFMEGHEHHLDDLAKILKEFLFKKIEIKNDLSGRKRFLKAQKR